MTLGNLRRCLAATVVELPPDDIADAIGVLAAASARLTARLVAPSQSPATDTTNLTAEQVANVFNVPVTQVYALARQRRIPSVLLGKYRRFDLAAVQQALATAPGSKLGEHQPPKRRSKRNGFQAAATTVLPSNGAENQGATHAD